MVQEAERTFLVGGLFSAEGKKEIEHNLIEIDGVREVKALPDQSMVNVKYDPRVIEADYLVRTLDSLGYSSRVM